MDTTAAATKSRRLIRRAEFLHRTGLSEAQLYKGMTDGWFPGSIALGVNTRVWVEEEIDRWIEERVIARDFGTDADLRLVSPNIAPGRYPRYKIPPGRGKDADVDADAGEPLPEPPAGRRNQQPKAAAAA
jgi:prophage regulatory protein